MKHKATLAQRELLFKMESGYHFEVLAGTEPPNLRCSIIDRNTKRPFASAIGYGESDALDAALEAAAKATRPLTPGDIAKENTALKAQLAALQAKGTPTQAVVEPMPPAPSIHEPKPAAKPANRGKGFDPEPGSTFNK